MKGGNESALHVIHIAGVSLAGPGAVHGLTYALRIIQNIGPDRAGTRSGRLMTAACEGRRHRPFCVVSGSSPIWLSAHLFQQVREDGKFKKWDMVWPPFCFSRVGTFINVVCTFAVLRDP